MIGRTGIPACPITFFNTMIGQTGMSDLPVLDRHFGSVELACPTTFFNTIIGQIGMPACIRQVRPTGFEIELASIRAGPVFFLRKSFNIS
jgi:hypothetical protein